MAQLPGPRFAARLTSRGIVRVTGADSLKFLQGLVTNDVHKICGPDAPATQGTAFLNGRGRVLFGVLLHRKHDNDYLIDVERTRVPALMKHLKQYKLRSKVDFDDASDGFTVWSLVGVDKFSAPCGSIFDDPRLSNLGLRVIAEEGFKPPEDLPITQETAYDGLRILHGVPDGSDFDDTPLPLDLAMHLLNGVSFTKGCYLGQELTARSHFTGVLRKRVTPLIATPDADKVRTTAHAAARLTDADDARLTVGTPVFMDGKAKPVGTVSSSVHNIGLAILRFADVFSDSDPRRLRLEDGRALAAWQPAWWRERSEDAVPASSNQ